MIGVARQGGLWTLTLRRREKANALNRAMLAALEDGVAEASRAGARAVILTGDGPVFSAGADLADMAAGLATDPLWERLSHRIAEMECLTIAALNGTLAGGAFGMALACDLRIAVPDAQFFYPVMRLGHLPQPSDPGRLAMLVGPARAKMLLLAGARIGTPEALDWGLIDRVSAPEALLADAARLAGDAVGSAGGHAAALKRMLR